MVTAWRPPPGAPHGFLLLLAVSEALWPEGDSSPAAADTKKPEATEQGAAGGLAETGPAVSGAAAQPGSQRALTRPALLTPTVLNNWAGLDPWWSFSNLALALATVIEWTTSGAVAAGAAGAGAGRDQARSCGWPVGALGALGLATGGVDHPPRAIAEALLEAVASSKLDPTRPLVPPFSAQPQPAAAAPAAAVPAKSPPASPQQEKPGSRPGGDFGLASAAFLCSAVRCADLQPAYLALLEGPQRAWIDAELGQQIRDDLNEAFDIFFQRGHVLH